MSTIDAASGATTVAVELLDADDLALIEGGVIPTPPLWLIVGGAGGGAFLIGAAAGAAFYWYTHR